MTYNATYTSDDAAPIVIDFGATVVVTMISFAAIIALVILARFFKRKGVKMKLP